MSTINEFVFINIVFSILMLIIGIMLFLNVIRNKLDKYVAYILLLSSFCLVFSHNPNIIDFTHFSFMMCIYFVSLFSNNIHLLILNLIILIVIILSRKYFGQCILNKKQNKNNIFKWINDKFINTKGTITQGNILFCGIILLTLLRIYCA
jgi:hypothetical protein